MATGFSFTKEKSKENESACAKYSVVFFPHQKVVINSFP
jgi:hypothetical protein